MTDYFSKYLKYKNKYLILKNLLGSGGHDEKPQRRRRPRPGARSNNRRRPRPGARSNNRSSPRSGARSNSNFVPPDYKNRVVALKREHEKKLAERKAKENAKELRRSHFISAELHRMSKSEKEKSLNDNHEFSDIIRKDLAKIKAMEQKNKEDAERKAEEIKKRFLQSNGINQLEKAIKDHDSEYGPETSITINGIEINREEILNEIKRKKAEQEEKKQVEIEKFKSFTTEELQNKIYLDPDDEWGELDISEEEEEAIRNEIKRRLQIESDLNNERMRRERERIDIELKKAIKENEERARRRKN